MVEILLEAGMDPNCFDGASGTDILLVLSLPFLCALACELSVVKVLASFPCCHWSHSQTKSLGMKGEG